MLCTLKHFHSKARRASTFQLLSVTKIPNLVVVEMKKLYVLIILVAQFGGSFVHGANVLGLMPVTSPSHHIWNSAFLHRLGELGHNVTILSVDLPKPNDRVSPNVHYIHLEKSYSSFENDFNYKLSSLFNLKPLESVLPFYEFCYIATVGASKSDGLQVLLNYPDSFKVDLIIYDYTLGPILLGFMHKFNYPPTIGISAFLNPPNTMDSMSNPYFPAYIPHHSTDFLVDMNFWERFENTLVYIFETAYRRLIYIPKMEAIMRPFFPNDMPTLLELSKHTKISMVNSHPLVTYVEPVPPNVIEVAGINIQNPRPLPKDIEEFLNNSTNGVIIVSFGTNIDTVDLRKSEVQLVVDTMKQLSQYDFIWKVDVKKLKDKLPGNVLPKPFLPQHDLLAHPKIKAFVTHGGALSTHESIWRGVKMIGIPFMCDQHRNMRQMASMGAAVNLDIRTLTTEELSETIKSVAEDRQMTARLKYLSSQFRDRPMKPLDTAVWWAEYLIRNPNPEHLKSPSAKLYLFQLYSVDVLLVMCTMLVVATYLAVYCLLSGYRMLSNEKKTKHKKN